MREQRKRQQETQTSQETLARRLDELSREEMDRVLERAIRIHSERSSAPLTFTRQQIDQVASELGLPPSVVARAIAEERAGDVPAETGGGLIGPRRVVDRLTVEGNPETVAARLMGWMENEEGLRPTARVDGGVVWERDSHWSTSARLALGSEGTKALRGMRRTIHRITPAGENRHIVEIDVDTHYIRMSSGWTGAGVGLLGVGGGVATALAVSGGNDLLQFLSVAAPAAAAGLGTTILIGRAWTVSIRTGVRRVLDAVAHPDLYQRAFRRIQKRNARSGLERLVDEVTDALDRLRE